MIIDTIQNASTYFSLYPLFVKAFEFTGQTDLANELDGKSVISERPKVIFSNSPGNTKEAGCTNLECHDKNINIQLCIKGQETIYWKPREKCITPNRDYNPEKDVRFSVTNRTPFSS